MIINKNFSTGMKIIVTGGAGFIGSHIVDDMSVGKKKNVNLKYMV